LRRARAFVVNVLVERLAHQSEITSLLDSEPAALAERLGIPDLNGSVIGFIAGTQADLRAQFGLVGRRSLGLRRGGTPYFVDSSRIQPSWLGALVRRWLDYRLASEQVAP
jgi:hypothetical protein